MDNQLEINRLNEVVTEGQFWKHIFENDYFINKINNLQQENFVKWQQEENQQSRETLWNQNQALIQLLTEMKLPVILAAQAQDQIEQLKQ